MQKTRVKEVWGEAGGGGGRGVGGEEGKGVRDVLNID
jgi:hypothetical protein